MAPPPVSPGTQRPKKRQRTSPTEPPMVQTSVSKRPRTTPTTSGQPKKKARQTSGSSNCSPKRSKRPRSPAGSPIGTNGSSNCSPMPATTTSRGTQPVWAEEQAAELGAIQHPDWCSFYIDKLGNLIQGLIRKCGRTLRLNLWLDFAGMAPEKESGNAIAAKLCERFGMAVEFEIHMACDLNESSRKFIGQNFAPKHMAEDATQRNWETCTLITTLGELLVMPREGVDIYIACYPCGPWSKRGKRLGLNDNDGRLYEVAINTVAILNPFAYLMENVPLGGHWGPLGP